MISGRAANYKSSSNAAEQTYYYAHNWRGDVVALYDSTGTLFATYDYDAWGKLISVKDASGNTITSDSNFAILNSIRYRGYYYDTESGLYYLQSRYYDPTTGRFVNADSFEYLGANGDVMEYNLFTYCNSSDSNGKWVSSILGFTFQCGAIWGAALSIYWIIDHYGNHALYIVTCASFCLPTVGLSASWFNSWRNSIYDINGACYSKGFSLGNRPTFGLDVLYDNYGICGLQFNMGLGSGLDVHINAGSGLVIPFGKNAYMCSKTLSNLKLRWKYNSSYRLHRRGGRYR